MSQILSAAGRAMAVLLPWPTRSERRASIKAARQEKEKSRRAAAHADAVKDAIDRMASENHFAAAIAEQIIERQRGDGKR